MTSPSHIPLAARTHHHVGRVAEAVAVVVGGDDLEGEVGAAQVAEVDGRLDDARVRITKLSWEAPSSAGGMISRYAMALKFPVSASVACGLNKVFSRHLPSRCFHPKGLTSRGGV